MFEVIYQEDDAIINKSFNDFEQAIKFAHYKVNDGTFMQVIWHHENKSAITQ